MTPLDRRLHAYRPNLAAAVLEGRVEATRYADGRPAVVTAPVADIRSAPRMDAGLDTQFLLGDAVTVFDEHEGWAWVQGGRDGYVGYMGAADLAIPAAPATHLVAAPRTFLYREPDMKRPATCVLSMGSQLAVVGEAETRGTRYALLESGEAVIAGHLRPAGAHASDYVAVAETLLHAPYLWGGASAFGIDCSGLVQLSMRMAGRHVLRDTDMQAGSIGTPVAAGAASGSLERGDLVFWKGHVGIMADPETLLHANGHTMTVAREPLREAIARIGYLYGGPTAVQRP